MKNMLIAGTMLLAGSVAFAQAQPASEPAPAAPSAPHHHEMASSRADVVAMVRQHFATLDANKDGAITRDEIAALGEGHEKRRALRRGEAPDGVRHQRMDHDPNAAFDRLDANKDGSISREEFAKAREERIERRIVRREEVKERIKDAKHRRASMNRVHHGMGGRMIVMADTDRDGKITLAEAEAMALKHFDEMDKNRDGQLSPEERGSGHKMMIHRIEEKNTAG